MLQNSDNTTESKPCENCGRELYGRTDKRFCNDNCRNEFNRRKKQAELLKANEAMPEILRIIKRNYEILRSIGEIQADSEIFLEKKSARLNGFDFRFYTSVKQYPNDGLYHFCFERGWKEIEGIIYIKDDLGQANTKV